VHDLRRTASALLNEVGFNGGWIEKRLAHEEGSRSSRSVYNKAEYAGPRRHMLQEWADMVEACTHVPKLVPEDVSAPVLTPYSA
jgi:integrase